jgi:hypothetical protein
MEQKILKKIQQLTEDVERDTKERMGLLERLKLLDYDIRNNCLAIQTLKELLELDDQEDTDRSP